MAAPELDPELLQATADAYRAAGGNQSEAARALDLKRQTFQSRLNRAAAKGFLGPIEAPPGMVIKTIATKAADGSHVKFAKEPGEEYVPQIGHLLAKDTVETDAEGRVIRRWSRYKPGEIDPIYIAERMALAFDGLRAAEPVTPPADHDDDLLTLLPLADLHLGLYAWGAEAGHNWDLATAISRYRETMAKVAACTPPAGTAIVLGGGDYLHANTNEFRTQSGNVLDGDGRTDKVIDAAIELAVYQVDLALQRHARVVVRFLKGNHDEYASIAIVHALGAWYRNEPRVTVDKSPDLFWWYRFGKVLLGATHGHNIKPPSLPMVMANRVPHDWGETEFRYGHTFHIHHKTKHVDEHGGVIVESHQSPAAQDSWHFGRGYLSGRTMQSITYHRERGEDGRKIQPL